MISLEVRRTLVKSPPELWTELSDPSRLAGHLRELGDIRIVRTDPEQMVEWEAQDARGSVLIKPSGWGTKVTLTVLRDTPEPEPPAAQEAPADSEALSMPGALSQPDPPAAQEAPADSEALSMPVLFSTPLSHIAQEGFGEPAELLTPVTRTELKPMEVHEDFAEQEDFAEPAEQSMLVAPDEPGSDGEPPELDCEPELEPRRGFFARLFGRRHKSGARESDRSDSIEAAQPAPGATVPTSDETLSAADELGASFGPARQQAGIGTPATEAGRRPGHEEPTFAALDGAAGETLTQEEPAIAADVPPAAVEVGEPVEEATDGGIPDISAELRTAEEVEAEQVRAVLTSMLDRLGAAHHRPFSRA